MRKNTGLSNIKYYNKYTGQTFTTVYVALLDNNSHICPDTSAS